MTRPRSSPNPPDQSASLAFRRTPPPRAMVPARRGETTAEQRVNARRRLHEMAIEDQAHKSQVALDKFNDLFSYGTELWDDLTGEIFAIADRPGRSPRHQAAVDKFTDMIVPLAAKTYQGTLVVTAHAMGEVVAMPVLVEEPEKKKLLGFIG